MSKMLEESISIFFSYAQDDERLQKKLEQHLSIMLQQGKIVTWHKRNIHAGLEWQKEIDSHINTAQIILLLISASFLASQYCYSFEMQRALERQKCSDAHVIPIILRPVDWRESPFGKLEVLPKGGKPVTGRSWKNLDEAFNSIAHDIRGLVIHLQAYAELAHMIPTLPTNPQLASPKVLIMEDDEIVGNYLKLALEKEGFQSEYAIDGEEGIMKATKMLPALILLDLAMPVVEGFEVIKRLRAAPETCQIPIIILTSRDNEAYRIKASELGINRYILKPFHISELLFDVRVELQSASTNWGKLL